MAESIKRKPNTKCFVCSKEIYRRPKEIENGRVFCGAVCYGNSCRKEVPCLVCGNKILSGLNKKTCSRSCANKNREGTVYKLGSLKDKAVTLRRLKVKLLSERGGNCERCGYGKREILHVHHKNRNRQDNRPSNLELICSNCHYEEHYL